MKTVTVGIIGINGKYGQWLKRFFESLGHTVIGSDLNTETTNQSVVEQADVVIFSVWPSATAAAIREMISYSRTDQLWLEVTSIKAEPVKAMLASQAEVVGLHPMCAPTVKTLRGQTVIVCPVRVNKWRSWIMEVLRDSQATIKLTTPEDHDHQVAFVQGLPHAAILVMAAVLRRMNVDVSESLEFTSPFYRIAWGLMGRILAQNADLYANIQMLNPNIPIILAALEEEIRRFRELVVSKDKDAFLREFGASAEHFGQDNCREASTLFDHLNRLMTDLAEDNSVMLQAIEDHPGILHQISGILAEAGINLTSFHSFRAGKGYRFWVGLDRPRKSPEVQAALKRINEETPAELAF